LLRWLRDLSTMILSVDVLTPVLMCTLKLHPRVDKSLTGNS